MPQARIVGDLDALVGRHRFGASVLFSLEGHGQRAATAEGLKIPVMVQAEVDWFGHFSLLLWGNDSIEPAGTVWSVSFRVPGLSHPPRRYVIAGAEVNLNSLAPVEGVPKPADNRAWGKGEPPDGPVDGANRRFRLHRAPSSNQVAVAVLDGLVQETGADCDFEGQELVFHVAPMEGQRIQVFYFLL